MLNKDLILVRFKQGMPFSIIYRNYLFSRYNEPCTKQNVQCYEDSIGFHAVTTSL